MEMKPNYEETSCTCFKLCEGDILKLLCGPDVAFMQCLRGAFLEELFYLILESAPMSILCVFKSGMPAYTCCNH